MQGHFEICSQTKPACFGGQGVCHYPGLAGPHPLWEGLGMNCRVFWTSSVGQMLAGLHLGAQRDMTPGGILGGQDWSWLVARSLKAARKSLLSMNATKLLSVSREISGRPPILPSCQLSLTVFSRLLSCYLHPHSPSPSAF